MTRFLYAALAALFLSSCGGGGDGGAAVPPPSTPSGFAEFAGVYHLQSFNQANGNSESLGGSAYLHADGSLRLTLDRHFQNLGSPVMYSDFEGLEASGTLSSRTGEAGSGTIEYDYRLSGGRRNPDGTWMPNDTTREGSGAVQVSTTVDSGGTPALTVTFPDASVPFGVRTVTLAKLVPAAAVPLERLSGHYHWSLEPGFFVPSIQTLVHVDAVAGTMSGRFGADCVIGGRMWGYDAANGVYRQEWTFTGAGCPVQGTGEFIGQVVSGQMVSLSASGLRSWRGRQVTATLPIATLPGAFGEVAGHWSNAQTTGAPALAIHPDGSVWVATSQGDDSSTFLGTLARSGDGYVAQGEFVATRTVQGAGVQSRQAGTATLALSPAKLGSKRALAATLASATVSVPHPAFTVGWDLRDPFLFLMPLERLTGQFLTGWVGTPGGPEAPLMFGSFGDVRIEAASGAISGTLGACTLSGRLFDYDAWSGVFKQDLSLQGAECPVVGSGRLLGEPRVNRSGLWLGSAGIVAGRSATLVLSNLQAP